MMSTFTFVWYLVVASPQGGLTTMPIPFDTRDDCLAAVAEYGRNEPASDGWVLKCIPSTAGYDAGEEGFSEMPQGEEPEAE